MAQFAALGREVQTSYLSFKLEIGHNLAQMPEAQFSKISSPDRQFHRKLSTAKDFKFRRALPAEAFSTAKSSPKLRN